MLKNTSVNVNRTARPAAFPVLAGTLGAVIASLVALATPAAAADVAIPPASSVTVSSGWTLVFDSEARYTSWSGPRGFPNNFALGTPARGSQFYVPLAFAATGLVGSDVKLELLARTGYVDARQNAGGGLVGHVSTMTDTVVSATATWLGTPGFQPFLALNANLPTGRANLAGTQAFARSDPDLVEVPTFGEGFNLGATLGGNIPIGQNSLATVSVSHTHRGAFTRDPTDIFGGLDTRIEPGASTSGTAQLAHIMGALLLRAAVTYTYTSATRIDGGLAVIQGDAFALTGTAAYTWNPEHVTTFTTAFNHTRSNANFILAVNQFQREAFNSNSNALRLRLDHAWRITPQWTLGMFGSWFHRDSNAYVPTAFQFIPAKTKLALGGSARYQVAPNSAITVRAEHFWVNQASRPDIDFGGIIPGTSIPALSFTGWTLSLGGNITF
ncbi:hypothetical protein E8L99_23465 [Phreatobacter aquaticus]|uniref:Porin n=1 Tax=Phreatobacter aquaticus TaxID=2570229 RepID=A0A4D7QSK7_9HYPH|nr:hypothetical protein [Phreatobacter aquaticus]QCK88506.1 hypothetical protein E8L99_23465 [Phreatobacter aquaticus]